MRRTAFVTGAAGFVGRHLVEELIRQGWAVTVLCLPTDEVQALEALAELRFGDLKDIESILAAMPNSPDAIFHVAGNTSTWSRDATAQYEDNVLGTANLIEVALRRSAGRFIYTSSISAFGYQPGVRIVEDSAANVMSEGDNYGKTKFQAEERIRQAVSQRGLPAVILDPVNILGPYDRSNWSRQLILPIARGELRVVPPGSATWAHVRDVVAAHVAAVDRGRTRESYLLGGVQASFKTVINEIEEILQRPRSRRATPQPLLALMLAAATVKAKVDGRQPLLTREQYRRAVGDLRCDDAKAQRDLGYRHADLHTMLSDSIAWLRDEHLLPDVSPSAERSAAFKRGDRFRVPCVDVEDETHHVECFRNEHVRIYLATITPGTTTLYHRHRVNTLYIVISGGTIRSEEPGHQRQRAGVGRSITTPTKLSWWLRRKLSRPLQLSTGTVLMQYHARYPLIHRLYAASSNPRPIKMLGVELLTRVARMAEASTCPSGLPVEYQDRQATTYRIDLPPGRQTETIHPGGPSLLMLIEGQGELQPTSAEAPNGDLTSGSAHWVSRESFKLRNPTNEPVNALLITLNNANSGRTKLTRRA